MQLNLSHSFLLAAFGAFLLLSSGGVSAAPVARFSNFTSSSPGEESKRVGHTLVWSRIKRPRIQVVEHHSPPRPVKRENIEASPWPQKSATRFKSATDGSEAQFEESEVKTEDQTVAQELPPLETTLRAPPIPDALYEDIIVNAIMALFTPEDKLAIRVKPADKSNATIATLTERKLDAVIGSFTKAEKKAVLYGTLSRKQRKTFQKKVPAIKKSKDKLYCPKDGMAVCIVGVYMLGDMFAVTHDEIITFRGSAPDNKRAMANSWDLAMFMMQSDPNGFWKPWYDDFQKRKANLPRNEARTTAFILTILKDGLARSGIPPDDVDPVPATVSTDRADAVERVFSNLFTAGAALFDGRKEREDREVRKADKELRKKEKKRIQKELEDEGKEAFKNKIGCARERFADCFENPGEGDWAMNENGL